MAKPCSTFKAQLKSPGVPVPGLNAGMNVSAPTADVHPSGAPRFGPLGQGERAFSAASTFLSGALAISASQIIGAPLKLVDPKFYDGYMAWTKESFAILCTTITEWWSPTAVRVTGDESMKDQLFQMPDGSLKCNFPHRLVLMANHQLYTDWLYQWWIAYTNKMHGRKYIILKESLRQIPILGWGAQFYNFIFLSRKWDQDRPRSRRALSHLNNPTDPMWLRNRWTEKDYLLEHFYRYGGFPQECPIAAIWKLDSATKSAKNSISNSDGKVKPLVPSPICAKVIDTEVKAGGWEEYLSMNPPSCVWKLTFSRFSGIFTPLTSAMNAVSSGDIGQHSVDLDALLSKMVQQSPEPVRTANGTISQTKRASQQTGSDRNAIRPTKLTAGKNLDPEVLRFLENAHNVAQRDLQRLSQPVKVRKPNISEKLPQTRIETIITRPLTTMAVQRTQQALKISKPAKLCRPIAKPASEVEKLQTTEGQNEEKKGSSIKPGPNPAKIAPSGTAAGTKHALSGYKISRDDLNKLGTFKPALNAAVSKT